MAGDTSPVEPFQAEDLYCMGCGYNLRGLAGDPRRCPECGRDNPLDVLLMPAQRIRRQLRKLETAPTWCFAAVLLAGFGLFLLILFESAPVRALQRGVQLFGMCCLLAGLVIWPKSTRSFARSCLDRPGWKAALLHFHLYAVIIFVLGLAATFGTCTFPIAALLGGLRLRGGPPAAFALVLVTWVIALITIRWAYRRVRALLVPLQRETAVAMYLREAN